MPTVAPLDLDSHCIAAAFIGGVPFFALADGVVHRLDHGHKSIPAHDGLLCTTIDWGNSRLITGGEDGKVVATKADGSSEILADIGRKWVTGVAAGPKTAIGFASGRSAWVRLDDGKLKEFQHPRSVEGIAFSPDGNFVVTTMQENALHGWKLADGKHMRMTGYPGKVKSLSWSAKGKWLASSGAPAAIVWPFSGKDGPMGKAPLELGTRGNAMVTAVACHPSQDVVAVGYDDGMVMAVRFADAKEVLLRRPGKGAVTSMMWDKEERRVAFGSAAGDCGVIDISA